MECADVARGIAARPPGFAPLSESFILSGAMVPRMEVAKARLRKSEADRREADAILEAVRRRGQTAAESLRALSAHNAAVLRMNKARG